VQSGRPRATCKRPAFNAVPGKWSLHLSFAALAGDRPAQQKDRIMADSQQKIGWNALGEAALE
jgi:hypothetical protein